MIKAYWPRLTMGLIVGVFMTAFALIPPMLTKVLIDNVYVTKSISVLHFVLLTTLAVTIASSLVGAVRNYFSAVVGGEMTTATTLMFFTHITTQPVAFFDSHRTGDILSRAGDLRSSLGAITRIFSTVITSGVQVIVVPPLLFYLNWKLATLSLIGLPLTTALSIGSSRIVRKYLKLAAEANAELASTQIDAISQIRTLKLLRAEHEIFARVRKLSFEALQLQLTSSAITSVVGVVRAGIAGIATALFTWYGWLCILDQSITLGGFLAFSAYLRYLTAPVASLSSLLVDFHTSAVALGRFFEYLDLEPEIPPATLYQDQISTPRQLRGGLEFNHVCFTYPGGRDVLDKVSFSLPEGATMAIVGESGAGKSTLIRLLCRIDLPTHGKILLGGLPTNTLSPQEVRAHISAVWQETGLFRGTLRDNLLLGVPPSEVHRLETVLGLCQLNDLIASMPNGLMTALGEAGVTISGGQRQRIVLARALLRNTPLLVLDEATSSIDSMTEANVLQGILGSRPHQNLVYVTHRVHTAQLADYIVVLNNGKVEAFGTHGALQSSSIHYRSLLKSARDSGGVEIAPTSLAGNN